MEEKPKLVETRKTEESAEAQNFSSANQEESSVYDARAHKRTVWNNIMFYFGFARMAIISAVFLVFCLFATWFFAGQRERFIENSDLRQSCTIMIIIFAIFAGFGLLCLILSIVQNIKKVKRKKTDKS